MSKDKAVQVVFKGEDLALLDKLKTSYGASTTSELVRDGIKVLAALQNLREPDGTITVTKGEKNYRIVLM
jgi:hypothetical protein